MRVERLLNKIKENSMMLSGNIKMMVNLSLYPIIEKHSKQAVYPNHADINPGKGGNQDTETDDSRGNYLSHKDSYDWNWRRIWLA